MIIKKPDGWGTALDACRICGAEGYRQDGQNVVCRHCGSAIYVPSIGQAGGCNPIGVAVARRRRLPSARHLCANASHEGDSASSTDTPVCAGSSEPRQAMQKGLPTHFSVQDADSLLALDGSRRSALAETQCSYA